MKKRLLSIILATFAATACALTLTACNGGNGDDETEWGDEYTVEAAYAKASGLGYEGTLEEFIESISGKDGVGISSVIINESGNLIVTLTNGQDKDCGKVTAEGNIINNYGCKHEYSEWEVGVAPTCTSIGYDLRTCGTCGDIDYKFYKATGHTGDAVPGGNDCHIYYCDFCGLWIEELHSFDYDPDVLCQCGFGKNVEYVYENLPTVSVMLRNDVDDIEEITVEVEFKDKPVESVELFSKKAKNLKNIYYKGTKEQWKSMTGISMSYIGDTWTSNYLNVPNFTIHCTDGDIIKYVADTE